MIAETICMCRRFEGVQLVVISNTLWVGEQVPCLTYGMRGMISLSLEVCNFDKPLPPPPSSLLNFFTSLGHC